MNVLLTGATGSIGKQLGKELVRNGHKLIVLTRNPSNAIESLPFPAKIYAWKGGLTSQELENIDCVIHLAGESIAEKAWTRARKRDLKLSRVDTTQALVQLFQNSSHKPKVWINASAVGFYGQVTSDVVDENSSKGEGFLADLCDEWEKASQEVEKWGTRRVLLRIGVVLEKRSGFLKELLPIYRSGLGGVIGNGKQHLSWIHIDDLVRMFVFAMTNESISSFVNAVAPEFCTNAEFVRTLSKILGKPAVIAIPKWAVAVRVGRERASLVFTDQRVHPSALERTGFLWKFSGIQSALEHLIDHERDILSHEFYAEQWLPTSLGKTFAFFSDEKNLERITPPWLSFKVLQKSTDTLQTGSLIDYRLQIKKVPAFWRTKIETWNPPHSFTDTQVRGPYKLWHHTHQFEQLGSGTLMIDRVIYRLPLHALGLPALPFVKKDVRSIFCYRRQTIEKMMLK